MYDVTSERDVFGETTAWPLICQVSKARPRGWSLGRLVPKTLSGWPERITLMPIRYAVASSSIVVSTLSWTCPERMSAADAGGNEIRSFASTFRAAAEIREVAAPGCAGCVAVTRQFPL